MKDTQHPGSGQATFRIPAVRLYAAVGLLPVTDFAIRIAILLLRNTNTTRPEEPDYLTTRISQARLATLAKKTVRGVQKALQALFATGAFETSLRTNRTSITRVNPERLFAIERSELAAMSAGEDGSTNQGSGVPEQPFVEYPNVGSYDLLSDDLVSSDLESAPPAAQAEPSSAHEASPPEVPVPLAYKPEAVRVGVEPQEPTPYKPSTQEPQEPLGTVDDVCTAWYLERGDLIAETAAERLQALVAKGAVQPAIAAALYREIDGRRLELGQAAAHLDVNNLDERETAACTREWANKIAPKHRTTRCDAAVRLIVDFLEGKTGYVDKYRRAHYSSRVNRRVA